jgi:hypothetical protein
MRWGICGPFRVIRFESRRGCSGPSEFSRPFVGARELTCSCIDCLDRTNVVQSALARHVLSTMLTQLGLVVNGSTVESVFNDVWANNGDTISLCYAHTSALKGDFVRTGKRDLHGMLHDGVSSLSRMFYGAVSDFFAQAVISFFLGHRNLGVFSEFLQNLQSSDASSLIQLSRVRSAASESI